MQATYGQTQIRWLEEAELKALFELSGPYRLLFETMYFYGLRRGEPGLLKRSDIDGDTLWVSRLKRREGFRHALPLVGKLKKKLVHIETDHLFPGYGGSGMTGSAVAKAWSNIVHKSGMFRYQDQPSAHCLRHSCAMRFSNKGISIEFAKFWLGHASVRSTEVYYDISANRAMEIALALGQ